MPVDAACSVSSVPFTVMPEVLFDAPEVPSRRVHNGEAAVAVHS
jgi:hypothetical protein